MLKRLFLLLPFAALSLYAQPDWKAVNPEKLRHFPDLIQIDTGNRPPVNRAPKSFTAFGFIPA